MFYLRVQLAIPISYITTIPEISAISYYHMCSEIKKNGEIEISIGEEEVKTAAKDSTRREEVFWRRVEAFEARSFSSWRPWKRLLGRVCRSA